MKQSQDKRIYRLRKPARSFLCALCGAFRELRYHRNLQLLNWGHIFLMFISAWYVSWDIVTVKGIFYFPIIYAVYFTVYRLLYRKELSCPYCGFDVAWYVKDVNKANEKVKTFFSERLDKESMDALANGNRSLGDLETKDLGELQRAGREKIITDPNHFSTNTSSATGTGASVTGGRDSNLNPDGGEQLPGLEEAAERL